MGRKLSNWIDAYMEYTSNTESTTIFHKWTALSCISAALSRKAWFKLGMFDIHTNLYIVIVSEPGIGRKSKAISLGRDIISQISAIKTGPSSFGSREALMIKLEGSHAEDFVGECDNETGYIKHSSLSIFSGEFQSLIGEKEKNSGLITLLTDLYDCDIKFDYEVKNSKSSDIKNPWVTILAASTPTSLAQCFPIQAIGGGFMRRVIFVWGDMPAKKQAIPLPADSKLRKYLIDDLYLISTIFGVKTFSEESRDWWINWYETYDFNSENRICKNPHFLTWYSVKPMHIIKIAMCVAAAKGDFKYVETEDFQEAIAILEDVEVGMEFAFSGVGRSDYSSDAQQVESIIKEHGKISEQMLFQIIWRDIDEKKFDIIYPTLRRKGTIKRTYEDSKGHVYSPSVLKREDADWSDITAYYTYIGV